MSEIDPRDCQHGFADSQQQHEESAAIIDEKDKELAGLKAFSMERDEELYTRKQVIEGLQEQLRASNEQLVAAQARIAQLVMGIDIACIASCNCLTKTPDIAYHSDSCRYKELAGLLVGDNLSALAERDEKRDKEVRAKALEDAAEYRAFTLHDDQSVYRDTLMSIAAELRAEG